MTDEASSPVAQGLLDTSVVIALEQVPSSLLPLEATIAAVTLAELAAGPHATDDTEERHVAKTGSSASKRCWTRLPFDAAAARAYGLIYAATRGP